MGVVGGGGAGAGFFNVADGAGGFEAVHDGHADVCGGGWVCRQYGRERRWGAPAKGRRGRGRRRRRRSILPMKMMS